LESDRDVIGYIRSQFPMTRRSFTVSNEKLFSPKQLVSKATQLRHKTAIH